MTLQQILEEVKKGRRSVEHAEKLLKKEGYEGASAIIGNGKMRVSIESFSTQAEAYRSLQVIREQKAYQNAWVLKY